VPKEIEDYINDCLEALGQADPTKHAAPARIREVLDYWEELWGGAVPPGERLVAAFVTNEPGLIPRTCGASPSAVASWRRTSRARSSISRRTR